MTPSNKLRYRRNKPLGPPICRHRPKPIVPPPPPPPPGEPPQEITGYLFLEFEPYDEETTTLELQLRLIRYKVDSTYIYDEVDNVPEPLNYYTLYYDPNTSDAWIEFQGMYDVYWFNAATTHFTLTFSDPPQYKRIQEWQYLEGLTENTYTVLWV